MTTFFISDLHLSADEPAITARFLRFLQQAQQEAETLYILGDLFDRWIGDDNNEAYLMPITQALYALSQKIPCYFMPGNRDFLVGKQYCHQAGLILLQEPTVINLYGSRVLLLHGDTLCTDDKEYLAYRAKVRNPKTMARFLKLPLWIRKAIARWLRHTSKKRTAQKSTQQMATNTHAILTVMKQHDVELLIHGHIHQPGIHCVNDEDVSRRWYVLGDWCGDRESVLAYKANGACELK